MKILHACTYTVWLIGQLILATWTVLFDTLTGNKNIDPCIVHYPLRVTSDWHITVFAASITLTPGTMTCTIIDEDPDQIEGPRHFVVHAVYGSDPHAVLEDLRVMEEKLAPHVREMKQNFQDAVIEYPVNVPVKKV